MRVLGHWWCWSGPFQIRQRAKGRLSLTDLARSLVFVSILLRVLVGLWGLATCAGAVAVTLI